ncbi:hypothetical protein [Alcanivorax sp.]|jgi:hypothetical protein|uniref:hypothetical protein n=1 Tax=Alcanivorax sp. TaxID=1872427 RepID=UPI0025C4A987|nr:hypothetical protein [Alcanivorax sp.]
MRRQINEIELDYLFHRIGTAIWHLQNVEDSLIPLIIIKGIAVEPNSLEESEALRHEAKLKKLTLGKLIGRLTELDLVESDFIERLREFNNERKWVVHNSVRESGDHLYTESGRNQFFSRIERFVDEAESIHKHIGELVIEYSVAKGMSRIEIEARASKEIARLKGET